MNKFIVFLFLLSTTYIHAQVNFDTYFLPKTLRLDYTTGGNSDTTKIYFEQLKEEPFWGGSRKNLVDIFNYGDYRLLVYDSTGTVLIYSRCFCTLFREWLDTPEAKEISRTYYGSVVMPFPKNKIIVKLQNRDLKQVFHTVYELKVDPKDYNIVKDQANQYKTEKIMNSGDPAVKLDIVVIPEGYTAEEMDKFRNDAKRFMGYFFKVSPYKENMQSFNFWAVIAPSAESGTDVPGENIWKNTILNSHFYTFGWDRYLTSRDVRQIRDLAGLVPYDQIFILVNTKRYGGGGFYNYYNLCASDNKYSEEVFTHEFGHAFAALGDEYDGNAYRDYDMTAELWEPNLTNLVNFESKWKSMLDEKTPVPTPLSPQYIGKLGVFEGGGYREKGIYRPVFDCKMRSNSTKEYCPVCRDAVLKMLKFYCE
ncbi:MAG: M64 family metallopeptidase [Bacteroidales bacterium]